MCRNVIAALVVLAALMAAGPVQADTQFDESARPLTGSFTGSGYDFQGEFSHLGRFTAHISKFEQTSPGTVTEEWTATAANGDTLRVSGVSTVTGFDSSTGLYTFSGTRTINGGTGRFAGATGTFEAHGETAGDFSTYFGQVKGTIGY
jgi:hypothetical protein